MTAEGDVVEKEFLIAEMKGMEECGVQVVEKEFLIAEMEGMPPRRGEGVSVQQLCRNALEHDTPAALGKRKLDELQMEERRLGVDERRQQSD